MKTFCVSLSLLAWIGGGPMRADAAECPGTIVCHEALVKFSKRLDEAAIERILHRHGAAVLGYFPLTRIYHLALPVSGDGPAQLQALRNQAGILIAAPNTRLTAQALPDDPLLNLQWGLQNTGQTGGTNGVDVGVAAVWDEFQDSDPLVVAVIDSGIDYEHPDLAANIWVNPGEISDNQTDDDGNGYIDDVYGYDFSNGDADPMDDYRHGTHVAGILGAVGDNALGGSGLLWHTKIMALKILNDGGGGNTSDAIPAIEYALAKGAKIFVMSWGEDSYNPALFNAILAADGQGALFFAAAGNQGRDTDVTPYFPADFDVPNLLSLGSIDAAAQRSGFSNFGRRSVDLSAPGSDILSTLPDGDYGYISGTSMAAPFAAGAAALLWSRFPTLTPRQVRNLLLQGSEVRAALEGKNLMSGTLDVAAALAVARDDVNQAPVAQAGPDQTLELGSRVSLQGSAADPDGDAPLWYEWTLSAPPVSHSHLDLAYAPQTGFVPDREGVYVATLQAGDSHSAGIPDSVTITIAGGVLPPPVPVLQGTVRFDGKLQAFDAAVPVPVGAEVGLDASESRSLFPENLSFDWSLIEIPGGSSTQASALDRAKIRLSPDLPGLYTLRLHLEDGYQENYAEISFSAATAGDTEAPPADPEPEAPNSIQAAAGGCALQVSRP